jgi:hypothetical protein
MESLEAFGGEPNDTALEGFSSESAGTVIERRAAATPIACKLKITPQTEVAENRWR